MGLAESGRDHRDGNDPLRRELPPVLHGHGVRGGVPRHGGCRRRDSGRSRRDGSGPTSRFFSTDTRATPGPSSATRSASRRSRSPAWRRTARRGWRPCGTPRSRSHRGNTTWSSWWAPRRCARSRRGSLVAQAIERGHPVLCKGRTAPGMFALLATRYFKEYGHRRVRARGGGGEESLARQPRCRMRTSSARSPPSSTRGGAEGRRAARPLRLLPHDRRRGGVRADARGSRRPARPAARPDPGRCRVQHHRRGLLEHPVRPVVELHVLPGDARGGTGGLPDGRE